MGLDFEEWMLTKDKSYVPTDDSMSLRLLRECWFSRDAEIAKLKDDNEYLYIAAIERDQLREQVTELKQQLYNLQFEPVLLSEWQQLEQERDQLRDQVKILRCECGAARYKQERTVRILTGIHALLYPPRFTDSEGRMWQFKSPIVEEQMQKLSDKIRTIPDEIEALAATADLDGLILCHAEPCRDDGRCQYAIDHGAEGLGHCPEGKCCMQLYRAWEPKP